MFSQLSDQDQHFHPSYSELVSSSKLLSPSEISLQQQVEQEESHDLNLLQHKKPLDIGVISQDLRPSTPILFHQHSPAFHTENTDERSDFDFKQQSMNTNINYPWISASTTPIERSKFFEKPLENSILVQSNIYYPRHSPISTNSLLDLEVASEIDDGFVSYFPKISTDLKIEIEETKTDLLDIAQAPIYPTILEENELSGETRNETTCERVKSPVISELSVRNIITKGKNRTQSGRIEKPTLPTRRKKSILSNITRTEAHTTQPGPIPASEPKIRIDPETGDELLSFSYSKQKIIKNFVISCPKSPIDISEIPEKFLAENCVYPRAMVPPEEYKGNRGNYERQCNEIGWRLSWYNSEIRNHRGLIQRAVDSWRNTRSDKTLRSRRVRKNDQGNTSC